MSSRDHEPLIDEAGSAVPPDPFICPLPPEQHHPGKLAKLRVLPTLILSLYNEEKMINTTNNKFSIFRKATLCFFGIWQVYGAGGI